MFESQINLTAKRKKLQNLILEKMLHANIHTLLEHFISQVKIIKYLLIYFILVGRSTWCVILLL